MRTAFVILGLAFTVALALPVLADSSSNANPVQQIVQLQRRVRLLERDVADLKRRARAQVALNLIQASRDSDIESRLRQLENRPEPQPVRVSRSQLAFGLISPRAGATVTAMCDSGQPISGGFFSDYPVDLKASVPTPLGWQISAGNPFTDVTARLAAFAICLT